MHIGICDGHISHYLAVSCHLLVITDMISLQRTQSQQPQLILKELQIVVTCWDMIISWEKSGCWSNLSSGKGWSNNKGAKSVKYKETRIHHQLSAVCLWLVSMFGIRRFWSVLLLEWGSQYRLEQQQLSVAFSPPHYSSPSLLQLGPAATCCI